MCSDYREEVEHRDAALDNLLLETHRLYQYIDSHLVESSHDWTQRKYVNYIFQFFEKYVTESYLTEKDNIIIHI